MKLLITLALIKFCYSAPDNEFFKEKNDVKEITTPSTAFISTFNILTESTITLARFRKSAPVCCECVDFYRCANGTINNDGGGILDVRFGGDTMTEAPIVNVDKCPGEYDVCCKVPDADPSCSKLSQVSTEPPVDSFTPPPDSNCECVSHDTCNENLVVSDGLGQTSIELKNGRMVNHSKCLHALDVCCYIPDLLLGNETDIPNINDNGEPCECVPPQLCTPDGYIKTDGTGLIDVRIGPVEPLKQCPQNPELVCCLPPKSDSEVVPRLPPSECGQRNLKGVGVRIVGFKEGQTQFGEYPWVAALLKLENIMGILKPIFLGGASLIHPRIVLTAAHKIKGVPWGSIVVRLGEWDTASEKESLPYQDVEVQEVIFHPKFVPNTLFHDIALIVLKEEAHHDFHISPICPAKSLDEVIETSCVINGWGVDGFDSGNYQQIMKSITLPLVTRNVCQNLLRKTRLSKYFRLHSSFICAGGEEGLDACQGDGGGPLACPRKDDPTRYLQVGITAWGIGCGMKDVPGVYADVAAHYPWIMEHVYRLFPEPTQAADFITEPTIDVRKLREKKRKERRQKRLEARRERQRQRQRRIRERNRIRRQRWWF